MVNEATDQRLLRDYAERQTQAAFAEVVRRHVDLVHSAARRLVVDAHLAEDVTQGVFVALARQAGEVARRLEAGTPLSGWLHVTTRNLAATAVRTEERRRAREQEAAMRHEPPAPEPDAVWASIAPHLDHAPPRPRPTSTTPHLDHALAELADADRDALLLRFFERRSARQIGERLGLSEDAAQKRVGRALERLRGIFIARGLAVPSASLAGVLTVNAVQTAPLALAGMVTAGVAATTGGTISTLGILPLMASAKLQLGAAVLVAAGLTTTVLLQQCEKHRLQEQLAELRSRPAAEPVMIAPASNAAPTDARQLEELVRLRGEVAQLRREQAQLAPELARLMTENARLKEAQRQSSPIQTPEELALEEQKRLGIAKLNYTKNWGLAFYLFADQHEGRMPRSLEEAAAFRPAGEDSGELVPEQFEIVYQGSLQNLPEPARTIVLREREPFPSLGRPGWSRTYLFADGHSEIHHSADGNFEPWERERTVPPPQ